MSRVLVTGVTGRVGSAVVDSLAAREGGSTVRAGVRDPDDTTSTLTDETEVVAFDFARPETWGAALDSVDGLFLVFPPSVGVNPVREFVAEHRARFAWT